MENGILSEQWHVRGHIHPEVLAFLKRLEAETQKMRENNKARLIEVRWRVTYPPPLSTDRLAH